MFCKYCGNQVKDGSAFCPGCGKNLSSPSSPAAPYAPQTPPPMYGNPPQKPPVYGSPQTPLYVAPGYGRSYAAGYSSGSSAAGYVYAAVIALFSLIFMIGQFTFKMVKVEWTSRHSTKYSFGKLAFDESGITEDGITLFVSLLSFLCIMTTIAFLIVAFILTKKRPSTGVKFAAASMIPIIVGRLGLILEVIHLKDGSDSIHICGSVIFSLLFCTLLCIAAFILSSTVSNR